MISPSELYDVEREHVSVLKVPIRLRIAGETLKNYVLAGSRKEAREFLANMKFDERRALRGNRKYGMYVKGATCSC